MIARSFLDPACLARSNQTWGKLVSSTTWHTNLRVSTRPYQRPLGSFLAKESLSALSARDPIRPNAL